MFLNEKNYKEAIKIFKMIIEINPRNHEAKYLYSVAQLDSGFPEEAIQVN